MRVIIKASGLGHDRGANLMHVALNGAEMGRKFDQGECLHVQMIQLGF
jgi:hypothetical protein